MRTLHLLDELPAELRGASVALGNFDGLHAGHLAVVDAARRAAVERCRPTCVATFDPPPRRLFQPDAPPFRLLTDLRRERVLEGAGVDACVLVPFNAATAAMTDAEFVTDVLARRMGVSAVAVGADFQFGRRRMGDVASLRRLAAAEGIDTRVVEEVVGEGEKLSSTRIRQLIASGDMEGAARQLGRIWMVDAIVEHGEKRGRTLGYPTANMRLGDIIEPAHGVYAVWSRIEGEPLWRPAVASFGRTPTTGERAPLLEVYLFDFAGDLYGRRLHTAFVSFLRAEARFASLDQLVVQMRRDEAEARARLAHASPPPGL